MTPDELLTSVRSLDDADRRRFIDALRDAGLLPGRRGERQRARNDQIVREHRRGLSAGQIARRFHMSRDAVKQVLRRRNRGYIGECTRCKIGNNSEG